MTTVIVLFAELAVSPTPWTSTRRSIWRTMDLLWLLVFRGARGCAVWGRRADVGVRPPTNGKGYSCSE